MAFFTMVFEVVFIIANSFIYIYIHTHIMFTRLFSLINGVEVPQV